MKAKLFLWIVLAVGVSACAGSDVDEDQLTKDIKQIDAYLSAAHLTDHVIYDNNTGIRFIIHKFGDGPPPHSTQKVKFTRTGKLLADGSVFATGEVYDNYNIVVPAGLRYCLGAILKGSSATFYMPSQYAFGTDGSTGVPSNSPVIYEVSLTDVEKTTAEAAQFTKDTTAILNYIKQKEITNANYHPSGIVYTIDSLFSGDYPTPYSTVTFDYTLKILSAPDAIVQQNKLTNSNVFGLIDGLKIGLPLVETGSLVTFYIPSGLAYGTSETGSIPANSNLIFQIKLISVEK